MSTDILLEMLNNIIHDLELTQGNNMKPPRKKYEQKEKDKDDTSYKKKSFLIKKGRDFKNQFCALCKSSEHGTCSHRFPIHGEMDLEKVKDALKANKLCLKCAQPVRDDSACAKGVCDNIKRPCYYCNSSQHPNVLCDAPRGNGRAPRYDGGKVEDNHSAFRPSEQ